MTPLKHPPGQLWIESAFGAQEGERFVPYCLGESVSGQWRQDAKCPGRHEDAVGDQGMNVWIEGDLVAEGLHVKYKGRLAARREGGEGGTQEVCNQATQLPEISAVATEVWSHEFGDGKTILAVRDRGKNLFLDPFAIDKHSLLVTDPSAKCV